MLLPLGVAPLCMRVRSGSRSAVSLRVRVQQLGALCHDGLGVQRPHLSRCSWAPAGYGSPSCFGCRLYAAPSSFPGVSWMPAHSFDHNWAVGFRFGEALHPGPVVANVAFPSPKPPPASSIFESLPRVLSRDSCGRPSDQPSLEAFFCRDGTTPAPVDRLSTCSAPAPSRPDMLAETSQFRLAIVNSTSLLHKEALVLELACQVYVFSETSAVAAAQDITTRRLRPTGMAFAWGSPVPSHWRENAPGPSLRGYAAGVAVASLFPLRLPFAAAAGVGYAAHRLVVSHIRIGPLHARVLAVYGWPANHTGAAAKNDALFHEAACLAAESPMPTLIAGDFNTDVTQLQCWPELRRQGYAELFDLAQRRFGKQLPATCRGSTRHDSALLPPLFQQMLMSAAVDTDCHLFDSHAPVLLTFSMPQHNPCKQLWRKPASWMEFSPSAPDMENHYSNMRGAVEASIDSCASRDELDAAFLCWASTVEEAVSQAIDCGHKRDPIKNPASFLPKRARGRCTYRFVKAQPLHVALPAGRQGDYNPPDEALSMRSRLKVKQVRRLQAFLRHLCKARQTCNESVGTTTCSLIREWHAICGARGFPPSFEQWLLRVACFHEFYLHLVSRSGITAQQVLASLPAADWLEDVLAYVRFDCEAVIRQEAAARKQFSKFCHQQDSESGLRQGYAGLRPKANPPFTAIPVDECQPATLTCCAGDGWGLYRLPSPEFFRSNCPAFADGSPAEVGRLQTDEVHGSRLWVRVPSRPLAQEFQLRQETDAASPRELQRCFADFWAPIWNRDKGASRTDLASWEDFLSTLPECPTEARALVLPLDDPTFWRSHLRHLKSKTSTGYCGFSNAELKWLPDAPLADLVRLFSLCGEFGWPRHLGRASVATIAKVMCPMGMHHGRPINVFANLYRLWASGVAKAILQHWASWLPEGVKGSIPGRSVRDLSLSLECRIERSLVERLPLAGFSIDIIKCFNQVPRLPLRFLLGHLQVPEPVLHAWFDFLESCQRLPVFLGGLGAPIMSTTGMPEGCPLSVVAQVAICWTVSQRPLVFGASVESYVDNFTWTGPSCHAIGEAIADAQLLCRQLLLPIDWTKSFAWSTNRRLKLWLETDAQRLLPEGCSLAIVSKAKDLGIAFKFRRVNQLDAAGKRLAEGHRRLDVLQNPGIALLDKTRLIQTAIWPAALYGFEGRLLHPDCVQTLRTCAGRALLGQRHSASSVLALSTLTPTVVDPEVYLLTQSVLGLQRMLVCDRPAALWWLQQTSRQCLQPGRAFGPASALAGMLFRNNWVLKEDGTASGPGNAFFSLHADTPKVIRAALLAGWLDMVPSRVAHRNGMAQAGVPAPDIADKILRRLPPGMQCHVAQTMAGGFMSNAARAKWDRLQDPRCQLCGQVDSKVHRLLECPAADSLRALYQPLLQAICEEAPHWLHCPYPTASQHEGFLRLFWRSRRLVPPSSMSHIVATVPQHVHIFSDGSCRHPEIPAARHAAWAVVAYFGPENADVDAQVAYWKRQAVPPPQWHVVAQGVVPGLQDINRAEACGLVQTTMLAAQLPAERITVWTDSENALRAVQSAPSVPSVPGRWTFCKDILECADGFSHDGLCFRKIKAHQDLQATGHDALSMFTALGNSIADWAAKQALAADLGVAHDSCQEVADWRRQQADHFYHFVMYLDALTKLIVPLKRAATTSPLQAASDATPEVADCGREQWLLLQPPPSHCPVAVSLPREWQQRCGGWPSWYSGALQTWIEQLRWPSDLPPCRDFAGITFLELLVSFALATGCLPPQRSTDDWVNLMEPEGVMRPVVLRDLTVQLVQSVDLIRRKIAVQCWPSPRHHRLHCLWLCGAKGDRKGLLFRPTLPNADQVFTVLCQMFEAESPGELLRERTWARHG